MCIDDFFYANRYYALPIACGAYMPKPIYERLRKYYKKVAEVLRGQASTSSIFPNTTDIGLSREGIYAELFRNHLPNKCNVFLGGFVFHEDGNESKQLDFIVNTDTTPRFRPTPGFSKSFSPIEGTLGIYIHKIQA